MPYQLPQYGPNQKQPVAPTQNRYGAGGTMAGDPTPPQPLFGAPQPAPPTVVASSEYHAPAVAPPVGTPAKGDLALNKKLQGESYFDEHKQDYTAPTRSEQVADQAMQQGHAPVTQNTQEAYGMWKNMTPADMSQYYQNAGRQAIEGINRRTAATGSYGSSAANDMTAEALTNLAADRAKAEAQYGLNRMQLGGSLASAADASSLGASQNERGWLSTVGNLASGADTARLAGLTAGQNAANSAEGGYLNRVGQLFGANLNYGNATGGAIGDANRGIFDRDMGLFGSGVAAGVAPFSEGAAQALGARDYNDSNNRETQQNIAALAKLFKNKPPGSGSSVYAQLDEQK